MLGDNVLLIALILSALGGLMLVSHMCSFTIYEPIFGGVLTGLLLGDLELGMLVGGTLMLMNLGLFGYGGASIPDFTTASIIGTAIGHFTGGENALELGLAVAIPMAVLLLQIDVLGRTVNTLYLHGAEKDIENKKFNRITLWHWLGATSWFLSRAIPIFIAVLLGNEASEYVEFIPTWFSDGMTLTGKLLPAVGFGLLLLKMDMKKYWPFLGLGFICYSYFSLPVIAITLVSIVSVGLLYKNQNKEYSHE